MSRCEHGSDPYVRPWALICAKVAVTDPDPFKAHHIDTLLMQPPVLERVTCAMEAWARYW